jgi:hypothetical protein
METVNKSPPPPFALSLSKDRYQAFCKYFYLLTNAVKLRKCPPLLLERAGVEDQTQENA